MEAKRKGRLVKNGDRNTKFYHACANQCQKSNQILKIEDDGGSLRTNTDDIRDAFVDCFSGLFSASPRGDLEPCLQPVEAYVSTTMNEELIKTFTTEKVVYALNQIGPLKALGLDGFPAGFFQQNWETMGAEVCRTVVDKFWHYAYSFEYDLYSFNSQN